MPSSYHILLTVDVEDWFQVENLKGAIPFESWANCESRVEKNTHRLLDLFDEMSDQISFPISEAPTSEALTSRVSPPNNKSNESCKSCLTSSSPRIRATFFVLGWIAERVPNLVREIQARGHEVASHGYGHQLCSQCSTADLNEDVVKSKKLLEDIIGERVYGYRAPSFSISDDLLEMIAEVGYEYDSSYNSFGMHGRYGKISLNGCARSGIAILLNQKSAIENQKFYELPISNLPLFPFASLDNLAEGPVGDPELRRRELGRREPRRRGILAEGPERSRRAHIRHFCLPWGGGAYFRLIPAPLFRIGVREILRQQQAYLFYVHPWEVDPEQPRPEGTTAFSRFKHYTNLSRTEGKLRSFLSGLRECRFVSCHEHLQPK